ncbi:MAG: MATE family efflux transporter [Candidatus Atribacteria bacterium]|nr:MATE family efflux transporter [Candidatus Atribacteria bacterium]MCD6349812.1 MATE family efflux transporter [Candidatus Atribacteria bacterium]
MRPKNVTDFTQGSIPRHLIFFSLPMLAGNLLQTFYNTVDSIWVGRFLGAEALGAVSVGFPVLFILISFVFGLGMGANIMVAQYLGARKDEKVQKTVVNALVLLTLLGIILAIVGIKLHLAILEVIRTPETIKQLASQYLTIIFWGLPFLFLYNAISSILRGMGDAKTPLYLLIYATVINIILDPLMILGIGPFPSLGVAGAALATTIAQGISGLIGLLVLFKLNIISPHIRSSWWDWSIITTMFHLGMPAGVQQSIVSLGILAMTSLVNLFGEKVVAAYGAATRIDQFSFLPAMTISVAISSIAGQNLGFGDYQRSREVLRWGTIITFCFALPIATLVFFEAENLIRIFITEEKVIAIGKEYLQIVAFSYIPFSLMFAVNGFLRGAGDTMQTMVNTLISLWLIRLPFSWLLSIYFQFGAKGIWIGMAIGPVVGFLVALAYYRSGRWKNKILVKREMPSQEGKEKLLASQ